MYDIMGYEGALYVTPSGDIASCWCLCTWAGPDLDSCGPWAIILGGAPPKNYLTHHTCTCILK